MATLISGRGMTERTPENSMHGLGLLDDDDTFDVVEDLASGGEGSEPNPIDSEDLNEDD